MKAIKLVRLVTVALVINSPVALFAQDTFLDNFSTASYSNNDGTQNFSTDWIETNEKDNGNPNEGSIYILNGLLTLEDLDKTTIRRSLDLASASSIVLTFDYIGESSNKGEHLYVQLYNNTTGIWETIATLYNKDSGSLSYNLTTDQHSVNSGIRFTREIGDWEDKDIFYIDNVQFSVIRPPVTKQLYLSDPSQALDRVDPVATGDLTTVSSPVLGVNPTMSIDLIATKDTGIKLKKPGKNYGSCTSIDIDRETTDIQRALFQFDLSTIPAGAIIESAELRLNCTSAANMDVSVFQIGNSDVWDEGTLCGSNGASNWIARTGSSNWDTFGVIGSSNGGTPLATINVGTAGIQAWPVTCLVEDWVSGASVNNGIVMGVYSTSGMGNRIATYDSRETTTGTKPTLHVNYHMGGLSFVQIPEFCSPFTIKAGTPINVTNYVSVVSGSMPSNPDITAYLKTNCANIIITLTNPSYNGATGLLSWSGTLGSDVTIPAGEAIGLYVATNELGVDFTVDYDSQTKPSKVEFDTSTYINISFYNVYDAPYPGGSIITQTYSGTVVYHRVVVTDPFGSDDITALNIAIPPPGGTVSATQVANSVCTKTYEYAWDTHGHGGIYNIEATANEGYENTVTDVENLSFTINVNTVITNRRITYRVN